MLLLDLLRERPAVIGWLNACGLSFWDRLEMNCDEFCVEAGLNVDQWLHLMENLPGLPENFNPQSTPLYLIADRLTADHRKIRDATLPAIERLLEDDMPEIERHPALVQAGREFRGFARRFIGHIRHEEETIFPYVLRLEATLAAPERTPDFALPTLGGAVRHAHDLEEFMARTTVKIRKRIAEAKALHLSVQQLGRLNRTLEALEKDMVEHADLETRVFFRRATALERGLSKLQAIP